MAPSEEHARLTVTTGANRTRESRQRSRRVHSTLSPHGDQIKEYSLAQMLEKLIVPEEEHFDADGFVVLHRHTSLKEHTGSSRQESNNRGLDTD